MMRPNANLWLTNTILSSTLLFLIVTTKLHGAQFDHGYSSYGQLLSQVVVVSDDNKQTRVDYQQLTNNKAALVAVLKPFSAVTKAQYNGWSHNQQLSFLINVYNAFTLQLIVDNWDKFKQGDADSIRDLGSFFSGPWEKRFFTLFDEKQSLDDVEHEMIRQWFNTPRIHAALVCAAVSCPPLSNNAFVADKLTQQLDRQMQLFLADNSRNEILVDGKRAFASLSPIFKWYRSDFEKGDGGFNTLYDLLSLYTDALVQGDDDHQAQREVLSGTDFKIQFKQYDWRLNDVANF